MFASSPAKTQFKACRDNPTFASLNSKTILIERWEFSTLSVVCPAFDPVKAKSNGQICILVSISRVAPTGMVLVKVGGEGARRVLFLPRVTLVVGVHDTLTAQWKGNRSRFYQLFRTTRPLALIAIYGRAANSFMSYEISYVLQNPIMRSVTYCDG